jgi:cell wall assembly regulator SMI1
MSLDIERIEFWAQAESIKLRAKANLEKLKQLEDSEKTFCREVKLKNHNNDQDGKTNQEDQA